MSPNNTNRKLRVTVEHIEMLKKIKEVYRANSLSHTIRLIIEDTYYQVKKREKKS